MAACESTMWWYQALHERTLERLSVERLNPGGRLLDAGCGTGGFLARIEAARPDLSLRGLEYDPHAADIARAKTSAPITVGSISAMPYPDASFEAIVCSDVLCHAQVDELGALAEMRRCLAPGGILLLNLPAFQWMLSAHDVHVHNVRRYTRRVAEGMARTAGFVEIETGYWNSWLFPLMVAHRLGPGRAANGSDVKELPLWQNRLLFSATKMERRAASHGLRLPFGGSVWLSAKT
jgi:SAM-dependent methyltransferase